MSYKIGVRNLPEKKSALQFTREQLDRLELGDRLTLIPWGSKRFKLPASEPMVSNQGTSESPNAVSALG